MFLAVTVRTCRFGPFRAGNFAQLGRTLWQLLSTAGQSYDYRVPDVAKICMICRSMVAGRFWQSRAVGSRFFSVVKGRADKNMPLRTLLRLHTCAVPTISRVFRTCARTDVEFILRLSSGNGMKRFDVYRTQPQLYTLRLSWLDATCSYVFKAHRTMRTIATVASWQWQCCPVASRSISITRECCASGTSASPTLGRVCTRNKRQMKEFGYVSPEFK